MSRRVHGDRQACQTCRRQKRKCDKALPSCSLCRKSGRDCHYDVVNTLMSPSPAPATSHRIVKNAATISKPSRSHVQDDVDEPLSPVQGSRNPRPGFPSSFFLDYDFFKLSRPTVKLCSASGHLPNLMHYIKTPAQIRHEVDVYFHSTHNFFPIVSKVRLYQDICKTPVDTKADLVLLLSALQLFTQPDLEQEPACRKLYMLLKEACIEVERSNIFSVRTLQATLLVALYEMANAIYPAAYLTIGHCARLSHAVGLHYKDTSPQLVGPPKTATDLEERRRVWWGIIVLDRYVNLGGNRAMACDDAGSNEFLPISDRLWDQGESGPVQPLVTSASLTEPASPFARTCQASHLLSRVLRHAKEQDTDAEILYQEAMQLHRALQALTLVVSDESQSAAETSGDLTAQLPLLTATGICLSALMSLYGGYSCAENIRVEYRGHPGLLEVQKLSLEGLKNVTGQIVQLAHRIQTMGRIGGMFRTSPFVSDCLYQAGETCVWWIRETGNHEHESTLAVIIKALELLGTRWKSSCGFSFSFFFFLLWMIMFCKPIL